MTITDVALSLPDRKGGLILELQHRLMRQTINIAISKALEDMQTNARRSIRNLIDLGLLFSRSENQKWFYGTAKKVIANSRNPYNKLAARMIADVDNQTIKTVGINFGYSSLAYGAQKLQKRQAASGCPLPWLLIFDISAATTDYFRQIEKYICEGRELGVYSYVFCLREAKDIFRLCEIAKRFSECFFVFQTLSDLITNQSAQILGEIHNAVVSVEAPDADINHESCTQAFRMLRQNRCLFGFQLIYNEINLGKVTTPGYIRRSIQLGNLFGVYVAEHGVSDACRKAAYTFACTERGETGRPLIALEWSRDLQNINEKILSDGGYLVIKPVQRTRPEYEKMKDGFENTLLERIRSLQPCSNL